MVGACADDARLHADFAAALLHSQLTPVARHVHQQSIRDRLTRQAGAGGSKGHRHLRLFAEGK